MSKQRPRAIRRGSYCRARSGRGVYVCPDRTIYFLFGFHDNYTCGLIAIVYFLFIRTAIAHSIREQVQTHTKCLNLIGYNYDGSSVHDEDLRGSFLPKITTILREEEAVEQFTPILEKLTEPEIDKLERDRERDKRFVEQCHSGK